MTDAYDGWKWPVPNSNIIGKRRLPRKDGYEKASGKAIYTSDITRPRMLYAKQLLSPYAHAKIVRMDTSKAKAFAGVRDMLRYDDPEIKWPLWRGIPLVPDTAYWFSQPVGAIVVAESEAICDRALRLIEIEWKELPFIIDWHEALKPGAPLVRPDLNPKSNEEKGMGFIGTGMAVQQHGDVDKGFKEADRIIEFIVDKTEEDVWAGVEPFRGVAEWKDDYLEVWHHGHRPGTTHEVLEKYTSCSKINVHSPYHGASFGGLDWLDYTSAFAHYAVIASKRVGRPVKMVFENSHFHCSGWEIGTYKFKVGFKNDGTVTAVKIDSSYCNATIEKLWPSTKIPNQYLDKKGIYLSKAPTICYKHGGCACHISTAIFDHVAGELNMDPTKVALLNDGCQGHDMAWVNENWKEKDGFDPSRDSLKEVLEIGKKAIDWDKKWHPPGTKILPNGKYHGIGVIWQMGWSSTPNKCAAGITIRKDGTASLLGRHADGGWGGESAYCRIAADELGFKYEDVDHRPFDDVGIDMKSGGGAEGLASNSIAVSKVAREMKQILLEYATTPRQRTGFEAFFSRGPATPFFPNKKPEDLDIKDSVVFEKSNPLNKKSVAEIAATGSWMQVGTTMFFARATGDSVSYGGGSYTRQCYLMEVEVDPETGEVDIAKTVVVNDVGRVIDPDSCNGQQYGGTYMGIGRCFTEGVVFDRETGVKLNDNLIGYGVPVMNDCGPIDCHLIETGMSKGAYGICGIGESAPANVCTLGAPAIYNAIGKWVDDFPITPVKILKALCKV